MSLTTLPNAPGWAILTSYNEIDFFLIIGMLMIGVHEEGMKGVVSTKPQHSFDPKKSTKKISTTTRLSSVLTHDLHPCLALLLRLVGVEAVKGRQAQRSSRSSGPDEIGFSKIRLTEVHEVDLGPPNWLTLI
eukprot:CAMPEP_0206275960 /NCGR_PEP_ID=MMETSP0047_2-20121206/36043_1 /ASSEMBLY_ACC=CAM_ASM_000192 /TAXON_ID=195065 /ORGANISM="Chroomonas mesostigmatica_cf, Strain CCMP1168" /LENGTH=131 /DNA_ID=CAMNT_0053705429 /DNA_START=40 /DNA_END=433 /DNA_ORIENTATION=-